MLWILNFYPFFLCVCILFFNSKFSSSHWYLCPRVFIGSIGVNLILLYPCYHLSPAHPIFSESSSPWLRPECLSPLVLSQLLLFLLGKPPSVSAGVFSPKCKKSDLFPEASLFSHVYIHGHIPWVTFSLRYLSNLLFQ